MGETVEDYDGSATIVKRVDITITNVWCPQCKGFVDIGDLTDDGDGHLACDEHDDMVPLLEYDE